MVNWMCSNGEKIDALSGDLHRNKAPEWGRKLCEKLKELIHATCLRYHQGRHRSENCGRETLSAIRKNTSWQKCTVVIFPETEIVGEAKEG